MLTHMQVDGSKYCKDRYSECAISGDNNICGYPGWQKLGRVAPPGWVWHVLRLQSASIYRPPTSCDPLRPVSTHTVYDTARPWAADTCVVHAERGWPSRGMSGACVCCRDYQPLAVCGSVALVCGCARSCCMIRTTFPLVTTPRQRGLLRQGPGRHR